MSPKRRLVAVALAVLLVSGGACVYIAEQHTYEFRTEPFSFSHAGNDLTGTLTLPEGDGPFGVVVFIHGDGPVNADYDGGYRPIWETLADAGYASVAWDKPGVGGSTGNWLDQSMQDRADEAVAAIAALKDHEAIDTTDVGLWGASQAGWVLPYVASETDPGFVIAPSVAINWTKQGRYLTETQLDEKEATPEVRRLVREREEAGYELLRAGAPYSRYRQLVENQDPRLDPYFGTMTAERWRFVLLNFDADVTEALSNLDGVPVMLQLAGQDRNVNVTETETTYRSVLDDDCLTVVHYPDATHSLTKARLENSPIRFWATAIFAPRHIFADDFLTDTSEFVDEQSETAPSTTNCA